MKFRMKDVDPGSQELRMFRDTWMTACEQENEAVLGTDGSLSAAQRLTIDLFCGFDEDWADATDGDFVVGSIGPSQAELEALVRSRNRALVAAFQRQHQQNQIAEASRR